MMKRTAAPRLGPDEPAPMQQSPAQIQQAGVSNMHTLAQSAQPQILGATAMLSVGGGGFARGPARSGAPAVINYLKTNTTVQYASQKQQQPPPPPPVQPRLKMVGQPGALPPPPAPLGRQSPGAPPAPVAPPPPPPPQAQFQRLKVEDALSYLDQVKYKFNTQPQVYNDFLDIMKEFKSQTIDTPGVITRVSNLFKGHPELIVGFNTFLPPGYKIEVQSNGQVSVSMPSPTGLGLPPGATVGAGAPPPGAGGGVLLSVHHQHQTPQQQMVHMMQVPQSVNSGIAHNLSVNAPPANTLHHISQAHQQIEANAIHHSHGASGGGGHGGSGAGQPVEFNHAIEYVNKIKSRFSRQPDKYKRFLEILHAYQRGHRDVKEPQAKQQTEQEVYSQVAKLFENQDDLLAEFGQFLPDAKAVTKPPHVPAAHAAHAHAHARSPPPPLSRADADAERFGSGSPPAHAPHLTLLHHAPIPKHQTSGNVTASPAQHHHLKRSPSFSSSNQIASGAPPAKKTRACGGGGGATGAGGSLRDVSLAEAAKHATMQEYNFFDRARKSFKSQSSYDNFLKCLLLFTNEIISSSELVCVTSPLLCRHPDLQRWLRDFMGPAAHTPPHTPIAPPTAHAPVQNAPVMNAPATLAPMADAGHPTRGYNNFGAGSLLGYERERLAADGGTGAAGAVNAPTVKSRYEPLGALRHDRPQGDAALDIDLSTCKRLGTSYCALPREAAARRCSGRTPLCKEVLNDTWVSFPTWSEDSTFVTSRKTQYEEYIYRCEDERFELDVVIETNAATIRVLEGVQKKLARMTADDAAKYRLDDCLGGHSPTIHQRALRRIYGDKVAVDIIAGLKKNPAVAVPVVLRRLKAKEEEWREAQKGFNKQWREQNEKYYLKSLDHQGINFKQNDLKAMRSKSLFNEVESAYAARRPGPHLVVDYGMTSRQEAIKIVRDAAELLIHHARRQTGIGKAEKRRIKQLLRHFLPDLLAHPRQPLSDDEEDKDEPTSPGSPSLDLGGDMKAASVKQEKHESSESDNNSERGGGRNNKVDKENKPKNNNNADIKLEGGGGNTNSTAVVKRSGSSNEDASSVKSEPRCAEAPEPEDDLRDHPPNEARFVCTSSWYLFLRLHGTLCARLGAARRAALALAAQEAQHQPARPPPVAHALRLRPTNLPADASSPAQYYGALLELVRGVLDGNTEPAAYEDAAREMLGIKAYPAYTLDKLVSIAVRQLQHCVSEPWSWRAAELAARGGMRGPLGYVRRAARYLRRDHTAFLVKLYGGDDCKVTFELLEGGGEGRASPHRDTSRNSPTNNNNNTANSGNGNSNTNSQSGRSRARTPVAGEAVSRLAAWSLYAERYAPAHARAAHPTAITMGYNKPVFLRRNARRNGAEPHASAATAPAPAPAPAERLPMAAVVRRRKPPRLVEHARLAVSRPHRLYHAGCLRRARYLHTRLHAARSARFHAWLRARAPPPPPPPPPPP